MRKCTLVVLINTIMALNVLAVSKLTINRPHVNAWQTTQGIITDPIIEVSPRGLYAQIDFTFKIAAQSSYSVNDTMEAVLNFDLPPNSFVHNSWLWLDDTTIIQAAIIDKGRAIQIYEGIVNRRRDPSLLVKTSANSYKLNVYPLKTTYPRKVKITFSVPFNWQNNKVNCELPIDILAASFTQPNLTLKIKNDNAFTTPRFTSSLDFNQYVTGSTAFETTLSIPSFLYNTHNLDFNLAYSVNMPDGIFVATYPNTANSGTYQLAVNPAVLNTPDKGRNIVFVLDEAKTNTIVPYAQTKGYLKQFLINKLSPNDSFNIFYTNNNAVQQVSTNWIAADSVSIMSALSVLPSAISSDTGQLESLLKTALSYCQSKPVQSTNAIIISSGNHLKKQAQVDNIFNNIKTHLGSFNNKIHVINNSSLNSYTSGISFTGNELLYNKLTLASDGNYYENGYYYPGATNYLDIKTQLSDILPNIGYSTLSYSVSVPIITGFSHSKFELTGNGKYNTSGYYLETGKYIGYIQNNTNLNIQVATTNGTYTNQPLINQYLGTQQISKAWINKYLLKLEGSNFNNNNTAEIIDSSINNRVLCNFTAFIALETGDTVKESVDENYLEIPKIGSNISGEIIYAKLYPNPFTGSVHIECSENIDEIEIFDIMGKKIFYAKPIVSLKIFEWNGKNYNNNELPAGIYIVKIRSGEKQVVIRALKQ